MASAEPVAWVLNLDAEDELGHAGAHTPAASTVARIEALVPRLAGLVREGDAVVWPDETEGSRLPPPDSRKGEGPHFPSPRNRGEGQGEGFGRDEHPSGAATLLPRTDQSADQDEGRDQVPAPLTRPPADLSPLSHGEVFRWGRAWCPTRWALAQLERAGVPLPRSPGQDVLRRVNHRRFAHALGQALPGAGYAETAAELTALLSSTATLDGASEAAAWLLKRPFGYAGRGRRKVGASGLTADDQAWVDASLRECGGLQVEPLVARTLDCALHGWLAADGRCTWGQPTLQEVDATGAWRGTTLAPAGALTPGEHAQLLHEGRRTAEALRAAGYFGAFGLDAFRWRAPGGELHFQPRSELNARYSMGWAIGLGDFRPPAGEP